MNAIGGYHQARGRAGGCPGCESLTASLAGTKAPVSSSREPLR